MLDQCSRGHFWSDYWAPDAKIGQTCPTPAKSGPIWAELGQQLANVGQVWRPVRRKHSQNPVSNYRAFFQVLSCAPSTRQGEHVSTVFWRCPTHGAAIFTFQIFFNGTSIKGYGCWGSRRHSVWDPRLANRVLRCPARVGLGHASFRSGLIACGCAPHTLSSSCEPHCHRSSIWARSHAQRSALAGNLIDGLDLVFFARFFARFRDLRRTGPQHFSAIV